MKRAVTYFLIPFLLLFCSCQQDGTGGSLLDITLDATIDGYVDALPSAEFDAATMIANEEAGNPLSVILIQFNQAELPYGSGILSATLRLKCLTASVDPDTISVYRITDDWSEAGITHDTAIAGPFREDMASPPSREITQADEGDVVIWAIEDIVQKWVNGAARYGLILMADSADPSGQLIFAASEGDMAPELEIWYRY